MSEMVSLHDAMDRLFPEAHTWPLNPAGGRRIRTVLCVDFLETEIEAVVKTTLRAGMTKRPTSASRAGYRR
jgi:hypothetical protein